MSLYILFSKSLIQKNNIFPCPKRRTAISNMKAQQSSWRLYCEPNQKGGVDFCYILVGIKLHGCFAVVCLFVCLILIGGRQCFPHRLVRKGELLIIKLFIQGQVSDPPSCPYSFPDVPHHKSTFFLNPRLAKSLLNDSEIETWPGDRPFHKLLKGNVGHRRADWERGRDDDLVSKIGLLNPPELAS